MESGCVNTSEIHRWSRLCFPICVFGGKMRSGSPSLRGCEIIKKHELKYLESAVEAKPSS